MTKSCSDSWTHVLRNIESEFKKLGYDTIYNLEGSRYSMPTGDDISLTFTDPPRIKTIPGNRIGVIYTFETTLLPPLWKDMINNSKCDILSPSKLCSDIFLNNGVNKDKIFDFNLGVDSDIFFKDPDESNRNGKFTFGTISINHRRKGLLELIETYLNTFTSTDNVLLLIKTIRTDNKYNHEFDVSLELSKIKARYKDPAEVHIITDRLDNIRKFYNGIDVFVSCTKTEGFFLPALEAMACEVPVICTGYGGQMNFLNENNSWLIDYSLRDAKREEQYWYYYKKGSKIAEPNLNTLSYLMKSIFENYSMCYDKIKEAKKNSKEFSWENSVNSIRSLYNI